MKAISQQIKWFTNLPQAKYYADMVGARVGATDEDDPNYLVYPFFVVTSEIVDV